MILFAPFFSFHFNQCKSVNMNNITFQLMHLITIRKNPIIHNKECPWNKLEVPCSLKFFLLMKVNKCPNI